MNAPDISLRCGDCLEIMPQITSCSIDMILCDPPYGTTQNSWDKMLPLDEMWTQFKRVIKPNGCIAIFAQAPFDKVLAYSNLNMFRYEWIVEKTKGTGFLNAKKMPLKCHENVLIFYDKLPTYNPQMTDGHAPVHTFVKHAGDGSNYGKTKPVSGGGQTIRYPRDVLKFKWDTQKSKLHPVQKPVKLLEYLIKTYTNEGDTVLDPFMGSGSAGIAALHTGRAFLGIEKNHDYYKAANIWVNEEIFGG